MCFDVDLLVFIVFCILCTSKSWICFLPQIREVFCPSSLSYPSGTPVNWMLLHLILSLNFSSSVVSLGIFFFLLLSLDAFYYRLPDCWFVLHPLIFYWFPLVYFSFLLLYTSALNDFLYIILLCWTFHWVYPLLSNLVTIAITLNTLFSRLLNETEINNFSWFCLVLLFGTYSSVSSFWLMCVCFYVLVGYLHLLT